MGRAGNEGFKFNGDCSMKLGLLFLVICVSQNCFASDIYKCIDAQGKKIFSDKPCPKDTNETKLKYKKTAL